MFLMRGLLVTSEILGMFVVNMHAERFCSDILRNEVWITITTVRYAPV